MSLLYDNKYQFIKDLGSGAFGTVFLAKEMHSENLVAIKQLKTKGKKKQSEIIHEMQIVSRFNHPHIVNYKHHFTQDDQLFIVMEYCSIGSLRKLLTREKIIDTYVWKWMSLITDTLVKVHEKGIIHHDIKPDNILLTEDRIAKLADFGIANTLGGTVAYMCPELLFDESQDKSDPRTDIYALGVTLMELLTKKNPFFCKSYDEILDIHDKKEFGISNLPTWQQKIILKAIAKIPEKRFQTMKEFYDAIQSQYVPIIFDKDVIKAGDLSTKIEKLIQKKKWNKALALIEHAEKTLKPNVNIILQKAKYYLLSQQIAKAKKYYENALLWNNRLDVQKELGWINLEMQNYPTAISLLSDYLHRNPSDFEAYNLLLKCFYNTNRYESALEMADILLEADAKNYCFSNNYFICYVLQNIKKLNTLDYKISFNQSNNPFLQYNFNLIKEVMPSHNFSREPTLKSKLLFMDYRFNSYSPGTLYFTCEKINLFNDVHSKAPIIKLGREGYTINDIMMPGATNISRRHSLIINCKDDIWIYDLDSVSGTFINNEKINYKAPLIGKNKIRIGNVEFEVTNDEGRLF